MGKPALCVLRDDVKLDLATSGLSLAPIRLFSAPTHLVDRDVCETDESLLQLIPYIVLRDTRGRVACYERGAAGGEDRLHGKLSIGLGGHVDRAPQGSESLHALLVAEAARELKEEVGLDADVGGITFMDMLYTGADGGAVDRVHLGLLGEHRMSDDEQLVLEDKVIENCRFLPLSELLLPETFERLERWSQLAVLELKRVASIRFGMLMREMSNALYDVNIESATGVTSGATQEVGAILSALGGNLIESRATARVYDTESAGTSLSDMSAVAQLLSFDLGA